MTDEGKTKELAPKPPHITWKHVQPRHYARAQEKKHKSKEIYTFYVLYLLERFDDKPIGLPGQSPGEMPVGAVALNKEQIKQVLEAFEAKFGPKEASKE